MMRFKWIDYDAETMDFVENWLDDSAVVTTGLDDGFLNFYRYWANEDGFSVGENFWCKVVFEGTEPFAVIAPAQNDRKITIMEIVVAPEKRGQGRGSKLLKELHDCQEILGFSIDKSEAIIFPCNAASQKAFENAGFRHFQTYEDNSALIYIYEK